MRLFLSDGVHTCGLTAPALSQALVPQLPHQFYAGSYQPLRKLLPETTCLILHLIGHHKGFGYAEADLEPVVRRYINQGKSVILLHASSAAFTHWSWWRRLVGLRWVRVAILRHPYKIEPTDSVPADLPLRSLHISGDECYVDLQPEGSVEVLMQTHNCRMQVGHRRCSTRARLPMA